MAFSALADKSQLPSDDALRPILGSSKALWDDLRTALSTQYQPLTEDWNFAGKKWGWSLRLKHKKRTITYLTPADGFFIVGFALGEKAVEVAHQSDLPPAVLEVVDSARKYAEGRAVRLEVRMADDVAHVIAIASAKMST